MPEAASLPQRRSIRHPRWDYSSPAWYFVTVTTRLGRWYFGVNDERGLRLSDPGRMVSRTHRRLWHRNYPDRILRTPSALAATRRYIEQNPRIHLQRAHRP